MRQDNVLKAHIEPEEQHALVQSLVYPNHAKLRISEHGDQVNMGAYRVKVLKGHLQLLLRLLAIHAANKLRLVVLPIVADLHPLAERIPHYVSYEKHTYSTP